VLGFTPTLGQVRVATVGMAKLDKKIMANDFRYLNYNFQIKD
jgi:hypothetical protein